MSETLAVAVLIFVYPFVVLRLIVRKGSLSDNAERVTGYTKTAGFALSLESSARLFRMVGIVERGGFNKENAQPRAGTVLSVRTLSMIPLLELWNHGETSRLVNCAW